MKGKFVLFVVVFCFCRSLSSDLSSAQSDDEEAIRLSEIRKELPPIDFLAEPPMIDGILDPGLRRLQSRMFTQVDRIGPGVKPVAAHYRLAYGTDFLYVYVEAQGKLVYNDRAYQNGDGFQMVIARPMPHNAPTKEFYVVACSAVNRDDLEWSRRFFWYYNVNNLFVSMSRQAQLKAAAHNGVISFELLLPWQDLHPYHPWLSEGIGFNLGFVKAMGKGALYYRVLPSNLDAENTPRDYIKLKFADPAINDGIQTFIELDRNHLCRDERLTARSVTLCSGPDTESVSLSILSGEGTSLEKTTVEYSCQRGLTRHEFDVKLGELPAGGYRISWTSRRGYSPNDETLRASVLTILPKADAAAMEKRLEAAKSTLSPGSVATIQFLLQDSERSLSAMKPYETASDVRLSLGRLDSYLTQAETGQDGLAARTGCFRRAVRSKVDNTLQPYAVRIPADYDPRTGKKYPLIVFLHGSASDERTLAETDFLSAGEFIELAPRGRGPSNGFTKDHAQEDIEEAIAAVIQSYPIDESRIVLTGFSMGGYGVYRTFYEHPERYRALAVFSGLPNLRDFLAGEDHPDFLEERNLGKFKSVPIFIFHGRADHNCPFVTTQELADKLKQSGARVELVTEDGAGHQRPAPETLFRYRDWLNTVIN